LKVLVVHQQVSVANEIKKQFDRAGWLVHLAHSGLDGLLTARNESFGLILSVIDLPVITGIEMMRAIRNFSPNLQTPAIFIDCSANAALNKILDKLNVTIHYSEPLDLSQITKMYDATGMMSGTFRLEPLGDSAFQ